MIDSNHEVIRKMDKLITNLPRDQYEQALFPTKANSHELELLIEYLHQHIDFVNAHSDSRMRFEIMKALVSKMAEDKLFDPMFDNLHEDGYTETLKMSNVEQTLANFKNNRYSQDTKLLLDSLCKMYAAAYERTCRRYFRPLAELITKKKVETCGAAINTIRKYYPESGKVLDVYIPHIRNSIDHNDWLYDKRRALVVFEDRDKPPIEMQIDQLRVLCEWLMVTETCLAAAENVFKEPLWRVIIEDTKKVLGYCRILEVNYDSLMQRYLKKGISLFQIRWMLEQVLESGKRGLI